MNGIPLAGRPTASWLLALGCLFVLMPSGGCRLCLDSEDLAYPAYGGAWQRTRREEGRVGSLFDPAGARAATLVSRDEPGTVDEIYRQRQSENDTRSEDDADEQSDDAEKNDSAEDSGEATGNKSQRTDVDAELKRRSDMLKELELEDIDIIPGDLAPPQLK